MSVCLICDSSIVATYPSVPAARFAFCFCCIHFLFVVRSCFSGASKQNQGRGLVDHKQVQAPSDFIAGRPKVALLFWFFDGFGCGVPLFIVIRAIYKYENR